MCKPLGFVLAAVLLALGPGQAEARFGKGSRPSSPPPSSPSSPSPGGGNEHPSSGVGVPRRNPYYGHPFYSYGYGFHGDPWYRYYYDPAWAWPYMGPGRPYFHGRYYDLMWRRRLVPRRPSAPVRTGPEQPTRVDLSADMGLVAQGLVTGLGLQVDGSQWGFGARLHVMNLATDDGSPGRDTLSLLSLKPGVMVVSRDDLRVRISGGLDVAFAPDAIFVGPGMGASTLVRVLGPLEVEAHTHWTPMPFTQLSAEAGLGLKLGPVRVRAGYRATYLDDHGRVDGHVNREFFSGPYAGLALIR